MSEVSMKNLSAELRPAYLDHYGLLPFARDGGTVRVATWLDHPDVQALDDLRLLLSANLQLETQPEDVVRAAIQDLYGSGPLTAERAIADIAPAGNHVDLDDIPLDDLVMLANEAPVIKVVNLLLLEALDARASDVHIEGYAQQLRVRYRIDGVLQDAPAPPAHLMPAVISRLKIMAELDIAERRLPQDGRLRLRLRDRPVDVRVATLPTLHGESVVLRLLDKADSRTSLEELGMAPDTFGCFARAIARPHGIVLVTGPTGSGKTTTLYAAVERIRTGREKILTVEDPVEYELAGVPQVAVNERLGVTFATALRALLRQDPDVMLVGEIRDSETAEIATHAALTGHLVLSTLHTNDAASALTRLTDLGVAPFLVASTVESVLAQRLVRRVCRECGGPPGGDSPRGGACSACGRTGYRGRVGIFELLTVDDRVRAAIMERRPAAELHGLALTAGMRSLADDGERQVAAGVTTLDELRRACPGP